MREASPRDGDAQKFTDACENQMQMYVSACTREETVSVQIDDLGGLHGVGDAFEGPFLLVHLQVMMCGCALPILIRVHNWVCSAKCAQARTAFATMHQRVYLRWELCM